MIPSQYAMIILQSQLIIKNCFLWVDTSSLQVTFGSNFDQLIFVSARVKIRLVICRLLAASCINIIAYSASVIISGVNSS
jgi:hypothetical protein